MSKLSQGTHIFFIDPDTGSPVQVLGATAFNPGGAPAGQIDDTSLEDLDAKYRRGLRTPGQASMTIKADPEVTSHIRLHELSESDGESETIKWVVGWSDGTAAPTADSNGDWVLPTTRTWFSFDGYVADFPFDFQLNSVVTTQVSIQRSGGSVWTKKSA